MEINHGLTETTKGETADKVGRPYSVIQLVSGRVRIQVYLSPESQSSLLNTFYSTYPYILCPLHMPFFYLNVIHVAEDTGFICVFVNSHTEFYL